MAHKIGSTFASSLLATTVWAILSATVGTCASYCLPFQALCSLGFDIGRELVGAGDPLEACAFDCGREVDP